MSHRGDRDLERRLRELRAPDEEEAEERSLDVVRAAYADHQPLRPSRTARRVGLGVACGAVALAIGLSPAGAKVGDFVSDVFSPSSGEPDAKPALRSLPAPGLLLVRSDQGIWIVHEDGSKRLLGDYGDATLSPHGLFVAAADGRQLVAMEAGGDIRWTEPAASEPIASPRWSPCCDSVGYRVAYRSGDRLHVIDADGTNDRVVARNVGSVAAAWRPRKHLRVVGANARHHVLTYVDAEDRVHTLDADTGEQMKTQPEDMERLASPPQGGHAHVAVSPDGASLARIVRVRDGYELVRQRDGGGGKTVLYSGGARLTGPTWSPNGRWLLVGLPAADQWLFIEAERPHSLTAIGRVAEQFNPGVAVPDFPRVEAWGRAPE